MTTDDIHRVASADGTEIAGRVHGQGPPLVFVHGGVGDGETSWRFLLPFLAERFTCYTMSLRGRGLSAPNPDQSPARLEQDVIAFADGIGEPVGLVGHSSGGAFVLGAAAKAARVSAIAVYEPALSELAHAEMIDRWLDAFARSRSAAAVGRVVEAAMILIEDVALANESELAAIAESGAAKLFALNVPTHLRETDDFVTYRVLDNARVSRLTMPILALRGSRTHPFYGAILQAMLECLPDTDARDVAGAGHLGPQLAPQQVAEELTRFFAPTYEPA